MTDREKLTALVHDARMNALWHNAPKPSEYIADMLINNGVVVREKGEWVPVKLTRRTTEYRCPFCGRWERIKQPYCNCGAKMDGGAECDNEM